MPRMAIVRIIKMAISLTAATMTVLAAAILIVAAIFFYIHNCLTRILPR